MFLGLFLKSIFASGKHRDWQAALSFRSFLKGVVDSVMATADKPMCSQRKLAPLFHTLYTVYHSPHHLLSDDTHTEPDNDIVGVLFMTTIALVLVD